MSRTITIICNTALHVHRSRMTLIEALQSRGAEIILISPYDESVEALREKGVRHEHVNMSQYGKNPISEIATYRDIRAALRRHRPSICLCYTIKANTIGALAAQSLAVPVINNIAGTGRAFEGSGSLLRRLVITLYTISLRRSARVFFQNSDDLDFFLRHGMVQSELAQGIPGSGVDLNKFEPSFEFPSMPVFLYVGRLLISKGAKMYIDAAREMCQRGVKARFLLVGERLDESRYITAQDIEFFTAQKGCEYLGQVPPNRIRDVLASCSFLVLPSFYGEGVPRTLLEAGAVGRPIISTDSVGCKDVIRHMVNGLKIAPRDQDELVAAMCRAAGMETNALGTMGRQGREIVERQFDERIVIRAYLNECQRLLTGFGPVVA
ncbi:MAG: glycosyltransferase family 4 protein [Pseudomonadota bacterium]